MSRFKGMVLVLTLAAPLFGTTSFSTTSIGVTVAQRSGTFIGDSPISTFIDVVDWTETSGYTSVSVSASLADNSTSVSSTGTAYLLTALGPSATVANLLGSAPISLSASQSQTVNLFNGLTIPSGSLYLVIQGDSNLLWNLTGSASTGDSGVTINADMQKSSTAANPFWNSTFSSANKSQAIFSVIGTAQSATPEPSSLSLGLLAAAAFGAVLFRNRLARPRS